MGGKPEADDAELIIVDAMPIWKDGRVLEEPREIVEYIDENMRPASLDDHEDPEGMWTIFRAHLMHMYLSTKEERAEALQEALRSGVDYGLWIVKRMREKYPEYW